MRKAKPILHALAYVLFNLVVACCLLEIIFVVMLHAPRLDAAVPAPVRRVIQQVYRHFNRALIQFDANCAQYDAEVTYTLKPGACSFENIEFRNDYRINHMGLRDDEQDLAAPEVIAIGDSHAMGWGVDQDQSLVRVMAAKTGLKTLNAAISSYGTVRELTMLGRLDTSRLRVLVLQYTDNDLPENRTFKEDHDHLPIMSREAYDNIVRYYTSQRSYYPGKYTYRLFMKVFGLEAPEPDQVKMDVIPSEDEAALFLHVLTHAGRTRLDDVQVIVFEINQDFTHPRAFIAALDKVARQADNPPFVRRLITLDSTTVLTPNDFYVLDDHMRASGQAAMGNALADLVRVAVSAH